MTARHGRGDEAAAPNHCNGRPFYGRLPDIQRKEAPMSAESAKEPWGNNVLVEFEDQIAWVTLNRPEKRNCMSPALNEEVVGVLDAIEIDDRGGVLALSGAGDSVPDGIDVRESF